MGSIFLGHEEALSKFTLKKLLLLVCFLDCAKRSRMIDHDPCLFCKDAEFKVRDLWFDVSPRYRPKTQCRNFFLSMYFSLTSLGCSAFCMNILNTSSHGHVKEFPRKFWGVGPVGRTPLSCVIWLPSLMLSFCIIFKYHSSILQLILNCKSVWWAFLFVFFLLFCRDKKDYATSVIQRLWLTNMFK